MRNLQITQSITNRETKSVETYFNEIGKVGLVCAQEEIVLAQKIRQGDQAALEKLTQANLRFVVSVAKKYQNLGLPLEDLISEGNLGLIKAAQRFDETRGFKFISFAVWWIRQNILLALAEHTRMVRLPMNQINMLTKMNRLSGDLESHLERRPTNEELAELMDISVDKIADSRYYSARTSSYDAPFSIDEDYTLIDRLTNNEKSKEDLLINESDRQRIRCFLDILSVRERRVIELSFGFDCDWPLSPADIGAIVGISSERVKQIARGAIEKLKNSADEVKGCFL